MRTPTMTVDEAKALLEQHKFTPGVSKTKRITERTPPAEQQRILEIKVACRVLHEAEIEAVRQGRPTPPPKPSSEPAPAPRPRMPEDVPTREQRAAAEAPQAKPKPRKGKE